MKKGRLRVAANVPLEYLVHVDALCLVRRTTASEGCHMNRCCTGACASGKRPYFALGISSGWRDPQPEEPHLPRRAQRPPV